VKKVACLRLALWIALVVTVVVPYSAIGVFRGSPTSRVTWPARMSVLIGLSDEQVAGGVVRRCRQARHL